MQFLMQKLSKKETVLPKGFVKDFNHTGALSEHCQHTLLQSLESIEVQQDR